MGLKASEFDVADLKGRTIKTMKLDRKNENTVTVIEKDGSTTRHRLPAAIVRLIEFATENKLLA